MKLSKLTTLVAAMFLGLGFAYAQDALETETVKIMMKEYGTVAKFKGARTTECFMVFTSYSTRSGYDSNNKSATYALYSEYDAVVNECIYEIYIDIWANIKNFSSQMKGIVAQGTYSVANDYDADVPQDSKGTFYNSSSFIRQYDAQGNWIQDLSFPATITFTAISGNRYQFNIETTDGTKNYNFAFGSDSDDTNDKENLKWGLLPGADKDGNVDMTYEEYLETLPEQDPENPTPSSGSPIRPTGIETVDGDVAQISFDGNTISLGATADAIVVDACGRVCLHTVASSIDTSNLATGIYIVKAGNQILKFLKK